MVLVVRGKVGRQGEGKPRASAADPLLVVVDQRWAVEIFDRPVTADRIALFVEPIIVLEAADAISPGGLAE